MLLSTFTRSGTEVVNDQRMTPIDYNVSVLNAKVTAGSGDVRVSLH